MEFVPYGRVAPSCGQRLDVDLLYCTVQYSIGPLSGVYCMSDSRSGEILGRFMYLPSSAWVNLVVLLWAR